MADFASAAGHWYDAKTGEPRYTIVGKNGNERPTTLRDARQYGWVPSVTGIIKMAAAEGLQQWIQRQIALSCVTLPRIEDESLDDFLDRAKKDAQEEGRKAAEHGEQIHAAFEKHYRGDDVTLFSEWVRVGSEIVTGACGLQDWKPERSFASKGYGGKTDLHSPEWVIDIKTKSGPPEAKLWDEHLMQSAAYREGLGIPQAQCGILFVQREQPGFAWAEASEEDLQRGWKMFSSLLEFWRAKNRYSP